MKKIISLMISGMMMLSMIGCGSSKVLQEQIDVFESIKVQEVKTDSIYEYCDSFNIEGLRVHYYAGLDFIAFEVIIDEDLYQQFQKDVEEIGLKEAREKYGINELMENMIIINIEQRKIINEIDKDIDVECVVMSGDELERFDENTSIRLSIYNGETDRDEFQ